MRRLALAGALLAAAATAAFAAPARDAAPFTLDDVYRVVALSAPQLSPDGARVLVVVRTADRERDRWARRLDVVDVASGARRTLALGVPAFASPRWSPGGDRIAFLSGGAVWIAGGGGEDARRVTDAAHDVVQFAWRPDGGALAFVALDGAPARTGDDRYLDAYEVGNDAALADGPRRPAHLFVQALDGNAAPLGAARALGPRGGSVTSGDAESTLAWSPDGTALAYVRAPTNVANDAVAARIRVVDVATGRDRDLPGPATEAHDPLYSPDGTQLAYAHSAGDTQLNPVELFVTSTNGASPNAATLNDAGHSTSSTAAARSTSTGAARSTSSTAAVRSTSTGATRNISHVVDRALRDFTWQPGTSTLLFTVTSGTKRVLYRVANGGTPRSVELGGALSVSSGLDGAIAKDGTVAFVAQTAQRPDELYVLAPGGAVKRLTDYNDGVASLALAATSRVTYRTSVGVRGDAVLTRPAGFRGGVRYPLVVVLHGGPTSAATETFDPLDQLLAARGWLVLEPNYRGSNNLGARYQRAVGGDKLRGPGSDVDAAIAAVRALGIVDDKRLAVSGWSYGAGLTLWMIAHRHDWRAAVAGAAVADIAADYATADDIAADRALLGGSPLVGPYRSKAAAMSPITYAAQVRTPLLLMTCRGDTRVSPAGVYEFYHALRDLGRDVRLVAYPVDGHFPSDPVRRTDVYRRWTGFVAERFGT